MKPAFFQFQYEFFLLVMKLNYPFAISADSNLFYKCVLTSNSSGKKLTSSAFFKKLTPEEPPVPAL